VTPVALSALVGVVAAAILTWLRDHLVARLPRPEREPLTRWNIGDVSALLVVVGVALGARLVGLASRPVDNDEPVALALGSFREWLASGDARLHPPLPGLLYGLAQHGTTDLAAARGVSLLAGVATAALAFAIARRAGRPSAFGAGIVVALAPAALHTSQLARGYALVAALLLAAHVCLSRATTSGRRHWWTLYSLAVAGAMLSEYLAIVPLLAEALVVSAARRQRVSLFGSLGAGLCLASFTFPVFFPTLHLGVGGGPHPPTGPLQAMADALSLWSGAPSPLNALLAFAVVGAAAWRKSWSSTEQRLVAAVLASLGAVLVMSAVTAVRARYLLHTFPMLVIALALVARRGVPLAAFAGFAAGHLALLPAYERGSADAAEISTGRPTPMIFSLLDRDPQTPVVVVPSFAVAGASWRLGRVFPGKDARVDCPVRLCARSGERRFYGADAEQLAGLTGELPRFYLLYRGRALGEPPLCKLALEEGSTRLFVCGRRSADPR
jgi:4-amino-4-deoxy-L-arabinose transferase-like glycosyltransferase